MPQATPYERKDPYEVEAPAVPGACIIPPPAVIEKYTSAFILGLDFDGTLVQHEYPDLGQPVPGAIDVLRREMDRGAKIILYTMRSGKELCDAVKYCCEAGIDLWGINENPDQHKWTTSRKVYAHMYIDDAACGCPLIYPQKGRPYVDWEKIANLIDHHHERTTPIQIVT